MKSLILYAALFFIGVALGLSAPFLASRYALPYLPEFLQETVHPLAGTVTHKEREPDRLLMTVTTQNGTILATFQKHVPEIDLLVEEEDSVTLDVKQYEPFVTDPPILKVHKHARETPEPSTSSPPLIESERLPDSPSDPLSESGETSDNPIPSHLPLD